MAEIVNDSGLSTGTMQTLFVSMSLLILTSVLAICWYQWAFTRMYKHLPSTRMDTKWLLRIMMGRYPKNAPFTSVFFQEVLKLGKQFQTEGFFLVWFVRPYLFFYNEEFSKTFFNELAAMNKSSIYDVVQDVFGNGLLFSEGEMWKTHRKLLNPAFSSGALKDKMHIFNENSAALVQKFEKIVDKPTEDLLDFLKTYSFNVMSESILGLKMNDEKYGAKAENYMKIIEEGSELFVKKVARPWLYCRFLLPLFRIGRRYLELLPQANHFIHEVVGELKESVKSSKKLVEPSDSVTTARKSVAEILIEQHLKDASFTMQDVHYHIQNFVIAGHDTTAYALMWCFYVLGQHEDVQEKVCGEIETVVTGNDVSHEELSQMKYLDCVLKETLRLYALVPFHGRRLDKEIQCGRYLVPKGTEIIFAPFLLHRNPQIYPDPEKFDPERFSDNSKLRPWMYTPFSEGYRNCIGKKFANLEMKVFLVHVLRRFRISSLSKIEDGDLDWSVVLKPTKPLRMLFTVREAHPFVQGM